jgi:hypothetical protein
MMTLICLIVFQTILVVGVWSAGALWALKKCATTPIKVEVVCGEAIATSYLTPIDNTIRINLDIEQ